MKTGIFVAAALVQLAAAQPHRHNHADVHEKRQVYVTDVSYATVTAAGPNVVVYQNAAGEPVTTSTVGAPAATEAPAAPTSAAPAAPTSAAEAYSAPPASSETSAAPEATSAPAAAYVAPPAAEATSAAPPSQATQAASNSNSDNSKPNSGVGIVYSPYAANGACKSQQDVNTDFEQVSTWGYDMVRIYGTDCDQITTVGSAARAAGMKLFAGVFSLSELESELQTIIDASNGDFSYIDTISIGNELVNSGEASAAQVVAAVNQARGILSAAGYTGKVVTVDTANAVLANPSLCQASDYAAVNAHPFFDPTILPGGAGLWAIATKAAVGAVCGKEVFITETGMPWGGACDGSMCPSYDNQKAVLSSLASSFPQGGYILLSAYNDLWKQNNAYTFDAEQNWGIYGDAPSSQ